MICLQFKQRATFNGHTTKAQITRDSVLKGTFLFYKIEIQINMLLHLINSGCIHVSVGPFNFLVIGGETLLG